MKLKPERNNVSPLVVVALTTRIFWCMQLTFARAQNAAWLCPLVGFVFCLPFLFAMTQLSCADSGILVANRKSRVSNIIFNGCKFLIASILILDCAASMRILINMAGVMALSDATVATLELPLVLIIAIVVILGMNVTVYNARLWLRIVPLLLVVIIAVQFKAYNPSWIMPVLGGGIHELVSGGLLCAGYMCLLTMLLPASQSKPCVNTKKAFGNTLSASAAASGLLLLHQMLTPAMPDLYLTDASRIETILSNGRVTISLQLLMIILWYGNTLQLITAEAAAGAACLRRTLPHIHIRYIAAFIALVTALTAYKQQILITSQYRYAKWLYPVLGATVLVLMICTVFRKGARKACNSVKESC